MARSDPRLRLANHDVLNCEVPSECPDGIDGARYLARPQNRTPSHIADDPLAGATDAMTVQLQLGSITEREITEIHAWCRKACAQWAIARRFTGDFQVIQAATGAGRRLTIQICLKDARLSRWHELAAFGDIHGTSH